MLTFILFALLLAACLWAARPRLMIPLFLVAPALLVLNAGRVDLQVFTWVKVLTLAVSMQLFAAFLLLRDSPARRRVALCVVGILALNILEAVAADAAAGRWANAVVGASLILTLAPARTVRASDSGTGLLYDLSWPWMLCYTMWNLTVVAGIYPLHWTDHLGLLAVPLAVAALRGREHWLHARAFSLAAYGCAVVLAIDVYRLPWLPDSPEPGALYPWLSAAAVALALWNAWIAVPALLGRWRRGQGLAR